MDLEKIGKFISICRKKKRMTQQELANKLGITDRAVSHWEHGRSLPDVSLYKSLCSELGITMEELINGENNIVENEKENAILIPTNEKNNEKKHNKFIITTSIFLIIIFAGLFLYYKKIKVNIVNDSNYLYDDVINSLKEDEFKNNKYAEYEDFNTFYSYYEFGIEKVKDYKCVYMWIYNQGYYIETDENGESLAIAKGSSMPIKAIVKNDKIQNIIYPNVENEYIKFLSKMFPWIIKKQVLLFDKKSNINKLRDDVENQKNIYYNYINLDTSDISLDDLIYNNLLFSIEYEENCDIPVQLVVFKDNKYHLYTNYKSCKEGQICTSMFEYVDYIEGQYDFDIIEIVKHSFDSNFYQYNNLPKYVIHSGKGDELITNSNNKYLNEFLKKINVDLTQCAKPKYV